MRQQRRLAKRCRTFPTAIDRTPPSLLRSAVKGALHNQGAKQAGPLLDKR